MGYVGSFNGFAFGSGARPGAAVSTLSGWRRSRSSVTTTEGAAVNVAGRVTMPPADITLGLGLIADSPAALDALVDTVLEKFDPAAGVLPLTINGRTRWAQVLVVDPSLSPSWPGPERTTDCTVQFTAEDPVLYASSQATALNVSSGSPVSTASGEAANGGWLVAGARRAVEWRLTANGATTNPTLRLDHADGSFEQVSFTGLSMTGGQVLTIGDDLVPKVDGDAVSGRARWANQDVTNARGSIGGFRLHPSTGSDGANEVTMSVASGAFSGFCKVRSTWRA